MFTPPSGVGGARSRRAAPRSRHEPRRRAQSEQRERARSCAVESVHAALHQTAGASCRGTPVARLCDGRSGCRTLGSLSRVMPADLDLDAGRDRRVRRDRDDHRDHQARLSLSGAGPSARRPRRGALAPRRPRTGRSRRDLPRRRGSRAAPPPSSHSASAAQARPLELRGDLGGRRWSVVVRVRGDVVEQSLARHPAARTARLARRSAPSSEPAVTDVSMPARTSRSSIRGSRWKAGQRSGCASTIPRSSRRSASNELVEVRRERARRAAPPAATGPRRASGGPAASGRAPRSPSARSRPPPAPRASCPALVSTSSAASRSFSSPTSRAIVAASLR